MEGWKDGRACGRVGVSACRRSGVLVWRREA
jgi:hypothetical protein